MNVKCSQPATQPKWGEWALERAHHETKAPPRIYLSARITGTRVCARRGFSFMHLLNSCKLTFPSVRPYLPDFSLSICRKSSSAFCSLVLCRPGGKFRSILFWEVLETGCVQFTYRSGSNRSTFPEPSSSRRRKMNPVQSSSEPQSHSEMPFSSSLSVTSPSESASKQSKNRSRTYPRWYQWAYAANSKVSRPLS